MKYSGPWKKWDPRSTEPGKRCRGSRVEGAPTERDYHPLVASGRLINWELSPCSDPDFVSKFLKNKKIVVKEMIGDIRSF